ncbi:MAG: hypothetical protein IT363_02880 [Methanoregulaceae archaeon]|nr:hypothetical protein [Methanoregulaceae archaeon]
MEPLARWIRREFDWSVPWPVIVSMLAGFGIACVCWFMIGDPYPWVSVGLGALFAVAGSVPMALHHHRNHRRVKLSGLVLASRRGHLSEAIGPRAEQLNEAALDLEQIVNSLGQGGADTLDRKRLIARSNERFRRAFDLALGAAAAYSYTREGAERQIDADLEWLRQVRQHTEKLLLSPDQSEESLENLHELEALVAAREEAIEELGLRG